MAIETQTIRDIVAHQPSAAAVLQRFDIDLCSQAGARLNDVCAELQLSMDQILEKLSEAGSGGHPGVAPDPGTMPLSRLIQHIVRAHHHYLRRELPRAAEMASKVAAKFGSGEPVFERIAEIAAALRFDLLRHVDKEEQTVFPYIAQLDQQAMLAYLPPQSFSTVAMPVLTMAQEHESALRALNEIAQCTNGFRPARNSCATRVALLSTLRALYADLRRHVLLEDDFLFPRAIELEARLNTRS